VKEEATIKKIDGGKIILGCDKSACEGCKSSLFCNRKRSEFSALNTENIALKEGDKVEITLNTKKSIFSVMLSLAFPLALFMASMILTSKAYPDNEGRQFLISAIFLLIGFFLSGLYFRLTKKSYEPEITDKL